MAEAVGLPPEEGEPLAVGGGDPKATGETTAGTFFLAETTIEAGFPGPPPHVHERLHDMFYVLEGLLTLWIGDRKEEAGPGTFVVVPPGVVHTFSNPGKAAVRFLNFNTPSGWENYVRDLVAVFREVGGPPEPAAIGRIAAKYDFRVAGQKP